MVDKAAPGLFIRLNLPSVVTRIPVLQDRSRNRPVSHNQRRVDVPACRMQKVCSFKVDFVQLEGNLCDSLDGVSGYLLRNRGALKIHEW